MVTVPCWPYLTIMNWMIVQNFGKCLAKCRILRNKSSAVWLHLPWSQYLIGVSCLAVAWWHARTGKIPKTKSSSSRVNLYVHSSHTMAQSRCDKGASRFTVLTMSKLITSNVYDDSAMNIKRVSVGYVRYVSKLAPTNPQIWNMFFFGINT